MRRRAHRAVETASLERSSYSRLVSSLWELRFQKGSRHSLISAAHCASTLCTNNTANDEHLSFGESGMLIGPGRGCLCDQPH